MLEMSELLTQFRQHHRDNRILAWNNMSDYEKENAIDYAFENATEIDRKRFGKIARYQGDDPIFMSMPEWTMLIWGRRDANLFI